MSRKVRQLIIEIPSALPPELSPNARVHWAVKMRASQQLRDTAYYCAYNRLPANWEPLSKASVSITIVVPDRRFITDSDNTLPRVKPAIDAAVSAGVLVDDAPEHLSYKPINWEIDKRQAPLIILTFRERDS